MRGWLEKMSDDELEIIRNAGVVLLQREITDSINIQVAKVRIKFLNLFDSNLDFIQGCIFRFRSSNGVVDKIYHLELECRLIIYYLNRHDEIANGTLC